MIFCPALRGAFLSAYEKSHHETVMAKFNFTANFAECRRYFFGNFVIRPIPAFKKYNPHRIFKVMHCIKSKNEADGKAIGIPCVKVLHQSSSAMLPTLP